MTIEEKIDEEYQKIQQTLDPLSFTLMSGFYDVEGWSWYERPELCIMESIMGFNSIQIVTKEVVELIRDADEAECLTSKCQYIRECKKFLINNKDYEPENLTRRRRLNDAGQQYDTFEEKEEEE